MIAAARLAPPPPARTWRPAASGAFMPFGGIYALLLIVALLEHRFQSAFLAGCSAVLFLAYIRALLTRYRAPMILDLSLIIAKVIMMISLITIAAGFYVKELGLVAHDPVYSAYFAAVQCLQFHVTCHVFELLVKRYHRQPAAVPAPAYRLVLGGLSVLLPGLAILSLLAIGLTQGFALLQGIDRFAYRANQGPFFALLLAFKPIIAIIAGTCRFRMPMPALQRYLTDGLMLVLMLSYMLFGEKFGPIILLMSFYYIPFLLGKRGKLVSPAILSGIVALAIAVSGATWFVYSDYGLLDSGATSERLFARTTGSAQLWYAAVNDRTRLVGGDTGQIRKLASLALVRGNTDGAAFDARAGIFYLVARYASNDAYYSIIKNDGLVQFTGGFEALLILAIGHIPMIAVMLGMSVIAALILFYLYDSIRALSFLGLFTATYLLQAMYSVDNQGATWQLFHIRNLIGGGILIAADIVSRRLLHVRQRPAASPPGRTRA